MTTGKAPDQNEVLQQLLTKQKAGDYQLPPLSSESPTVHAIKEWLHRTIEEVNRILKSMMPDFGANTNGALVVAAFKVIAWISIAIVVLYLIYITVRYLISQYRRFRQTAKITAAAVPASLEIMDAPFTEAEKVGDFARALRLMWKQYLRLRVLGASLTPCETVAITNGNQITAAMFSAETLSLHDYRRYKDQISTLEQGTS